LATDSVEELTMVQGRLMEVARATYRSYAEAADQFSSTNRIMQEAGFATRDTLDAAEALGLALVAGGTNAETGARAVENWSRAVAQGRLNTLQFTSLLMQTPRVAQALAAGLGKSTQELLAMARAGELVVQDFVPALTSQMA